MKHVLGALALAAALACTSGASAGDASCLWRHLPSGTQGDLLRAYAASGAAGLAGVPVGDRDIALAMRACGGGAPTVGAMQAAGATLAGAALRRGAMALLAHRVDEATLARAWEAMPQSDKRVVLAAAGPQASSDPASVARFYGALSRTAARAGAPPPQGSPLSDPRYRPYLDYLLGRAQEEAYQGRF